MGLNTGVQAEENNAVLPDYTLEETVVTAKKTDEKLLSVPGSVDVVTAKDIQEHNYQSVSEALQSLPGVFVFPSSDMSMGNGIQIRGNSGNGIKIMVDGMPMNDGFGGDNAWDTIPMNNIAKIEVVKGAGASIQGSGAVVKIYTKDDVLEPGQMSGDISSKFGSNRTWNNKLNVNAQLTEKLAVGAGYEKRSSRGYPSHLITAAPHSSSKDYPDYTGALKTDSDGEYIVGDKGSRGYDNKNISGELRYKIDDDRKFKFRYWHTDYRSFYRNPHSYIYADGRPVFSGGAIVGPGEAVSFTAKDFLGSEGFRESNVYLLNYNDEKNNWQVNAGIFKEEKSGNSSPDSTKDINYDGPGKSYNYPGKTYNIDIQKAWHKVGGSHDITAGASYRVEKAREYRQYLTHWRDRDSYDSDLPNQGIASRFGGKSKNLGIFLQDEYAYNDKLTFFLGARYDKFTKADGYVERYDADNNYALIRSRHFGSTDYSQLSPNLSVDYKADENTHYYISYSRDLRPPLIFQMFKEGSDVLANPGLKPEKTSNYEMGMKKQLNKNSFLTAALFKTDTADKIYYKHFHNAKGEELKQFVNGKKEERSGLELSLKHKFDKRWNSYFNYTYQRGKISGNDGEEGAYNIPRHILHSGVEYKVDKWKLLMDVQYASMRRGKFDFGRNFTKSKSYWLVNSTVNYKLNDTAGLQFAIYNLFDKKRYDDDATQGRTYTFGVNYSF